MQVAPVVITYAIGFGSTVMSPWSLYVIKAKHGVNVIFIFNITHFKNRHILYGLSLLSLWHKTPQSEHNTMLSLLRKIFCQQHLIKVV